MTPFPFYRKWRVTIPVQTQTWISKAAQIAAWMLAAAIVVLSLVPPRLRPETAAPHDIEHLLIYCAAGLSFRLGYGIRTSLLIVLFMTFAASVEISQLFVPGRHARLGDFVVDALAMCLGVLAPSLARSGGQSSSDNELRGEK
jgi:VanZ family protein